MIQKIIFVIITVASVNGAHYTQHNR